MIPRDEIEIRLTVEQDDTPVRGNVMASGDDDFDHECEEDVLRRLDDGDVWAWEFVTVEARWNGWVGRDTLGGCTYEDERAFRSDPYYEAMVEEAIQDLNRRVRNAIEVLRPLTKEGDA